MKGKGEDYKSPIYTSLSGRKVRDGRSAMGEPRACSEKVLEGLL